MRARSAAVPSGARACQKYWRLLRPTAGTPLVARSPATSRSSPAHPPSPDRITAIKGPGELGGISTSGRSATAAAVAAAPGEGPDGEPAGAAVPGEAGGAPGEEGAEGVDAVSRWKTCLNCGSQLAGTENPWPTLGSITTSPWCVCAT